jgi:hypothetical protein
VRRLKPDTAWKDASMSGFGQIVGDRRFEACPAAPMRVRR